jgi:hypothetical protein
MCADRSHARPAIVDAAHHIVGRSVAHQRLDGEGHEPPLPGRRAKTIRPDAFDLHTVDVFAVGEVTRDPLGQDANTEALSGEISREPFRVAFHTAHDRAKVGGQDHDTRGHLTTGPLEPNGLVSDRQE